MFWSHFLSFYFEQTLNLVIRVSFEWNLFFNGEFRKPYWSGYLDTAFWFCLFFSLKLSWAYLVVVNWKDNFICIAWKFCSCLFPLNSYGLLKVSSCRNNLLIIYQLVSLCLKKMFNKFKVKLAVLCFHTVQISDTRLLIRIFFTGGS